MRHSQEMRGLPREKVEEHLVLSPHGLGRQGSSWLEEVATQRASASIAGWRRRIITGEIVVTGEVLSLCGPGTN